MKNFLKTCVNVGTVALTIYLGLALVTSVMTTLTTGGSQAVGLVFALVFIGGFLLLLNALGAYKAFDEITWNGFGGGRKTLLVLVTLPGVILGGIFIVAILFLMAVLGGAGPMVQKEIKRAEFRADVQRAVRDALDR